ncbi:methylated-DNA--[protein]-cysteine S-methyltransferase [Bartonella sp. WD12.1]|uniref:methylated-DNA--[protein]-cysteine S-methyltransferase n=1 Tax=Bartonella sp. WD12.1 TaxID=1933903 RepID=UPI00099AF0E9|nr:methylated-DNA--[protein]-cysteine S-methyltransferase [Bartonella sp. WD12.1]OPB29246.1 DNA-O6-methylguanine--protein-cysteine S-methyltransferase [Bartonella sp. WD12.1]
MIKLKNENSQDAVVVILKETSIGVLLIAKSLKGICNIALGDTAEQLLQELKICFTNVQSNIDDHILNREIAHIIAMVETPKLAEYCDLQLDIKGTAFQKKVWGALCEVQCGETISYKELAQHIGMPKAVRAVANACAHNKLALAIPCHRVIYTNGAIAGYRWGIQRKQTLLHREQQECFV